MTWDDYVCPVCDREDLVPATGWKKSPILIIAEFPGDSEVRQGKPLVGATGKVFKIELRKAGINPKQLRMCNLWLHPKPPKKDDNYQGCFEHGASAAIREAKGRKAILLVGSDTVSYFTGKSVANVNGLKVKSDYLSAPLIMACFNPAIIFHSSIGEVRLTIQKFSQEINKRSLL